LVGWRPCPRRSPSLAGGGPPRQMHRRCRVVHQQHRGAAGRSAHLGDGGIAAIVTATMTAVPDPPMRLAYLGDPNELHTRRWLAFFAERGHAVHLLVRHDTVLESPLPPGIVLERMDPFEIRWYRPD